MEDTKRKNRENKDNIQIRDYHVYSDLQSSDSTANETNLDETNVDDIAKIGIDSSDVKPQVRRRFSKKHVSIVILAFVIWTCLVSGVTYAVFTVMYKSGNSPLNTFTRYPEVKTLCPSGWSKNGLLCVKIFEEQRTWYQAMSFCQSLGSDLLSLHDINDVAFINSKLLQFQSYWIGLNDLYKSGTFSWSDGTNLDLLNWKSEEPNHFNGFEYCVEINHDGGWNDANCYISQKFICQKRITSQCGNGDWLFYNGSCYMFGPSKRKPALSWNDSRKYCNENGGDLAVIETNDERQFLISQRGNLRALIWIGLSYYPQITGYKWINDTSLDVSNIPWTRGTPAIVNDGCVGITWHGNYQRDECDTKTNYVCEKK